MTDQLHYSPNLRTSWLVQRLQKPPEAKGVSPDMANAFSFGGGLINGGISKEGMQAIKSIFRFDYMGSAEFEWGIVPSCLSFLANNRADLVAGYVKIGNHEQRVWYLCHKEHEEQVKERITLLATKPPQAKERVGLSVWFEKDHPSHKYLKNSVGWLDCSNGFMFFVDKDMWQKTCELFEVPWHK